MSTTYFWALMASIWGAAALCATHPAAAMLAALAASYCCVNLYFTSGDE